MSQSTSDIRNVPLPDGHDVLGEGTLSSAKTLGSFSPYCWAVATLSDDKYY